MKQWIKRRMENDPITIRDRQTAIAKGWYKGEWQRPLLRKKYKG